MGVRFNLQHASIVGWLTRRDYPIPSFDSELSLDPWYFYRRFRRSRFDKRVPDDDNWRAPRIEIGLLLQFLEALPNSTVTTRPEDHQVLRYLIEESQERLRSYPQEKDTQLTIVPSFDVAKILAPLRQWFDVPFYFMPFRSEIQLEQLRDSTSHTLWLQCEDREPSSLAGDLLDPFPILRNILAEDRNRSFTACWTWNGNTAVIPRESASAEALLKMVKSTPPEYLWREIKTLGRRQSRSFNVVQLSDLHLGAEAVTGRKLAYVEQHLRERIDNVKRDGGQVQPIITGDLMDTPSKKNLQEFEAFRNRLTEHSGSEVICIPGNHDMRKKGFLWKKWEAVAELDWKTVAASESCKAIFICFDTSRDAKLAQGRITDDQFLAVSTKIAELRKLGDYSNYIRIALTHHHPFSTREDEIDTIPFLGIREERFLRMENGEHLIQWCARNSVPLILYGHKHRPRFIGQEVEVDGRTRLVRAVGCGSSFGIEGKPLSFNWITWKPQSKQWMVSFFADPGDGSGFQEKRLAMGQQDP